MVLCDDQGRLTEMQFFERFAVRLREEYVNEDNLEAEPHNVDDKILPVDVLETNWVDERA